MSEISLTAPACGAFQGWSMVRPASFGTVDKVASTR